MTPSILAVEPRNEVNVKSYAALDGGPDLLCSNSDNFVQLQDIPWELMKNLAHEYAETHDKEMLKHLLTPAKVVRKGGGISRAKDPIKLTNQDSPEVLAIEMIANNPEGRSIAQIVGCHCSVPTLRMALEKHSLMQKYLKKERVFTPEWNIIYESFATQKKIARTIIGPHISTMKWALRGSALNDFASSNIIGLIENSTNSEEFLQKLCSSLVTWLSGPMRRGVVGADTYGLSRPFALAWFAIWLTERGYLLFPMSASVNRGADLLPPKYRHFLDAWIRPKPLATKSAQLHAELEPFLSSNATHKERLQILLIGMNLAMPGIAYGRISAECIKFVRQGNNLSRVNIQIVSTIWRREARRLKAIDYDSQKLQTLTDMVIQNKVKLPSNHQDIELWSWVDNKEMHVPTTARYIQVNCRAGPNVLNLLKQFRQYFPIVAKKSGSGVKAQVNILLYFLTSIDDSEVPANLIDIQPKQLSSIKVTDIKTLQGFMIDQKVPEETKRKVYSTLKAYWKAASFDNDEENRLCPISDQLISSTKKGKHSTTTRRAIDMEILELILEENRANDFSFSRNRRHSGHAKYLDNRYVTNKATGIGGSEWWPGIAIMMDLLLQIPIRHKQGRFLDSGEGDEFTLDFSTLELRPNSHPSAQKNRNQAFVQRISLSPLRDEPGMGMHINTNKTGREYDFPWLLPDIAANIKRVIDWQQIYNPILLPVSDRDDTNVEKQANVEPVWVFPIFRDPLRDNHKPVSQGIILDYFRDLLRHTEKKFNLINKTNIRFFLPNGDPIYDIHSLRVTGVTRLLNMGVDPKIVRNLVGHSSLAMTWYYEQISNRRISTAMENALELRKPSKEAILSMTQEEQEHFLEKLFNSSNKPSLSISLLRGLLVERSSILDMRHDGLCPGMSCADAGVWRDGACSLCKYFATGPAFLGGLELKLNNLMAEIILNQKVIADLREQLYLKRRDGFSIRSLTTEIAKREQIVDQILQEWESQFQYVKRAEGDISKWLSENPVSSEPDSSKMKMELVTQNIEKLGLALHEAHHLALYTRLIEGAKNVEGFVPTMGARDARDSMLLEIVRHENKADLFYRLSPVIRKVALDQFALLLIDQELSSDEIEALIDGSTSLASISNATDWLSNLASAPNDLTLTFLRGGE